MIRRSRVLDTPATPLTYGWCPGRSGQSAGLLDCIGHGCGFIGLRFVGVALF